MRICCALYSVHVRSSLTSHNSSCARVYVLQGTRSTHTICAAIFEEKMTRAEVMQEPWQWLFLFQSPTHLQAAPFRHCRGCPCGQHCTAEWIRARDAQRGPDQSHVCSDSACDCACSACMCACVCTYTRAFAYVRVRFLRFVLCV